MTDVLVTACVPDGWFPCCDHCGCGTPDGAWSERTGHDDTCADGCNDDEVMA